MIDNPERLRRAAALLRICADGIGQNASDERRALRSIAGECDRLAVALDADPHCVDAVETAAGEVDVLENASFALCDHLCTGEQKRLVGSALPGLAWTAHEIITDASDALTERVRALYANA